MKPVRIALLALVCSVPLAASAQWQWLDSQGRKVFSDKAPPPDIAPNRILKSPKGAPTAIAAPEPTSTAAAAPNVANLPKPSGKDKALEERKKQAEAAEADKKKAQEAQVAAARADNCSRARSSKATLDSGVRLSVTNAKGEREILDDAQRATELKHLNEVIARDCVKAQ